MHIAQVASLGVGVSPSYSASTARVICALTEELVRQGHQVTLCANGNVMPETGLLTACPHAFRLENPWREPLASGIVLLEQVLRQARTFALLHFYADALHLSFVVRQKTPHVTTLHGWLDIPAVIALYQTFPTVPMVSISDAQRTRLPWLRWQGTVSYSVPAHRSTFHPTPGTSLAFHGPIAPAQGIDQAIAIAHRVGMPLKIGASVDRTDQEYVQQCMRPLLSDPLVEYWGEIGASDMHAFLGQAYALLSPLACPEPCDVVMIEALACGTPVIAYRRGSVPEILTDGVTGSMVENDEEAAQAVSRVSMLNRARCRHVFEERCAISHITQNYLRIYQRLVARPVLPLHALR